MDINQIKQAVTIYKESLNRRGYITSQRYLDTEIANYDGRYSHLLWMCEEILNDKVTGEKVHRWLGFIQGVLWDDCQVTIAQLKDHNR